MDLSFFRRAASRAGDPSPVALDYGVLLATLHALQSATPAARAQAEDGGTRDGSRNGDRADLIELLLTGENWRAASARRRGSFNPAVAGTRVNAV